VFHRARDHMGFWNRILEKQLGTAELNSSSMWLFDNLTASLWSKIRSSACEPMLDNSSIELELPASKFHGL
jgi:hypothetical protein